MKLTYDRNVEGKFCKWQCRGSGEQGRNLFLSSELSWLSSKCDTCKSVLGSVSLKPGSGCIIGYNANRVVHPRHFPLERKIFSVHALSVPILLSGNRPEGNANILLQLPPEDTGERAAFNGVPIVITTPAETEPPVMVTASGSSLMTIKMRSNQKTMNRILPARDIKYLRPHRAISILVKNFLKKFVLLPNHTIIAVGTKLPSTIVTRRKEDTD